MYLALATTGGTPLAVFLDVFWQVYANNCQHFELDQNFAELGEKNSGQLDKNLNELHCLYVTTKFFLKFLTYHSKSLSGLILT